MPAFRHMRRHPCAANSMHQWRQFGRQTEIHLPAGGSSSGKVAGLGSPFVLKTRLFYQYQQQTQSHINLVQKVQLKT